MNCQCCLDEETKLEQIIFSQNQQNFYKNLINQDSSIRQTKNNGRIEALRTSLKRKFQPFQRHQAPLYSATLSKPSFHDQFIRPIGQSRSQIQLPILTNLNFYSKQQPLLINRPAFLSTAINYTPSHTPITLNRQQIVKKTPSVVNIMYTSAKQPNLINKQKQNDLNFPNQISKQNNLMVKFTTHQVTSPRINPISQQIPKNNQNYLSCVNEDLERKTNSNNANTNSIQENNDNIKENIKYFESSNQKRKCSNHQSFRGSLSYYGGNKDKKQDQKQKQDEDPDRRSSLMSAKGIGHLQDVKCKKTQSIADADDQDSPEQFSEVIAGYRNLIKNTNKMTNSQTQISERTQQKAIENKRQIVRQNARKQSLSEI